MWFVCLLFVRSAMYEKDQQIISLEIGYIESSISFVSNISMFQNVQTTNWQNFELIDCKINSHFILVVEKSTESNFESPKLWEWHAFCQKKPLTREVLSEFCSILMHTSSLVHIEFTHLFYVLATMAIDPKWCISNKKKKLKINNRLEMHKKRNTRLKKC